MCIKLPAWRSVTANSLELRPMWAKGGSMSFGVRRPSWTLPELFKAFPKMLRATWINSTVWTAVLQSYVPLKKRRHTSLSHLTPVHWLQLQEEGWDTEGCFLPSVGHAVPPYILAVPPNRWWKFEPMHIEKVIKLKPPHCWTYVLLARKALIRVLTTNHLLLWLCFKLSRSPNNSFQVWLWKHWNEGEPSHTHGHQHTGIWERHITPALRMGPVPSDAGKGLGYFWTPGTEYNSKPFLFLWDEMTQSRVLQELAGKGENPAQHASSCLFQHLTVSLFSSLWGAEYWYCHSS